MEKMIEMQKKRKEEKPVAMLIKGGMLFKDGKTTEEKKVGDDNHDICPGYFPSQNMLSKFHNVFFYQADDMGMTVKEMITMTEGLTRNEVSFSFKRSFLD